MAKTTDELFAEATEADYETSEPVVLAASDIEEEFQFRIDEHLRTIAIPEKGVVAGVEGDLNVNIARFTMVRYYHGRDLSKLNIRINYRNANGQVNYYTVSDATISGDSIVFSWEYAADVTQYKGNVQFVVYLFSAASAVLKQKFFTTLGTLEVLEGLEVDSSIPVSEQTDILLHLKKDLSAYAEEVKKSLPADYTAMTEQVSSLKEDLSDLQAEIEGGGGGLTADLKAALDQLAQKVAYIDEDGQDYYDALHNALYPPANLVRISCVYMQSSTVYDTDSLDDLKSDLVVTAHFSDSTTQTVTTYTLSGTLTEGTSTVTVSYGGKTTTFNVTVTHNTQEWVDGVPYSFEWVENKYIENKDPGAEESYSGWNASPFLNCSGAGHINIHNGFFVSSGYNAWYDENKTWIDKFSVALGDSSIAVPSNAVYFRVSYDASRASGDRTYTITPMEA